jgi:hypothetical protein
VTIFSLRLRVKITPYRIAETIVFVGLVSGKTINTFRNDQLAVTPLDLAIGLLGIFVYVSPMLHSVSSI